MKIIKWENKIERESVQFGEGVWDEHWRLAKHHSLSVLLSLRGGADFVRGRVSNQSPSP